MSKTQIPSGGISSDIALDGDISVTGTTPSVTVGDAGAEDAKIVFDGNAQDYHIGLDDSADTLVIGKGSALGTTTSMSFDANGIITKPLQPCFFVYKSSSQDVTNTSNNDITFDTERFDLNADFGSNVFTAPVTGKYHLSASVGYINANASGTIMVYINTSNFEILGHRRDASGDDSVYGTAQMSAVVDMDANDTAKLIIDSSHDDDYALESATYRTYFSGYLVA